MPDKAFKFSEGKTPDQICSLRRYHNHEDYQYNIRPKGTNNVDLITKCRECKIWLLVQVTPAPSAKFTGENAWRVVSKVASPEIVEQYTREGKVRDV